MKILFFREGGKMLTKRKKIFILFGMVALLVITGCLNMALTKNDEVVEQNTDEYCTDMQKVKLNKPLPKFTFMQKAKFNKPFFMIMKKLLTCSTSLQRL